MKNVLEMTMKEIGEISKSEQVQIEINLEPDGIGGYNTRVTFMPWEKYEPICPYGQQIVYAKGKDGEQDVTNG